MKRSRKSPDSAADRKTTRGEFLRGWRAVADKAPPVKKRKNWRSLEERRGEAVARKDEFAEELPAGEPVREVSRRTFLKIAGASTAVGVAIGCGPTGRIALPLLNAQPEQTPGVNLWYATVCGGCPAGCGALAKSRDGRPLKLEGNPDHPVSRGALCAIGQAQMRSLYDSDRLQQPEAHGVKLDWAMLDGDLNGRFKELRAGGGAIRVLSPTLTSPTLRGAVGDFLAGFKDARHVTHDAISLAALSAAYAILSGTARLPRYRLEHADLLVGLEADFLGAWLDPAGFTKAWSSRRDPAASGSMSKHVQIEAGLSLTGAGADERISAAPADLAGVAESLCVAIERRAGLAPVAAAWKLPEALQARITVLAESLWAARGKALVVCGLNDLPAQLFTARLNRALGAEGVTLDLQQPSLQRQGNDGELSALIAEMAAGKVAGLLLLGANPLYELPDDLGFAAALEKVPLRIALGLTRDETAARCTHLAPDCHFLEAWRDSEPVAGVVGLGQPLLEPLFKTRDALESILAWSGTPATARDHIRASWEKTLLPKQAAHATLEALWTNGLEKGFVAYTPVAAAARTPGDETPVRAAWTKRTAAGAGFQLLLYAKAGLGDGRHANIAWLQELPDPVTKVTWDNYAQLSPAAAKTLGVSTGDLVTLAPESGAPLTLPALIQPGLHDQTVAVALGYGRTAAGKTGNGVGVRAAQWLALQDGLLQSAGRTVAVTRAAGRHELACTQLHHTLEGRHEIAQTLTLSQWREDPAVEEAEEHASIYPPHAHPGARWGMAVDMAKCTGCSACVVSCMAENNIPTVGRDEVARQREMHWLRLDRYYTGDENAPGMISQPMMCQQCDNAPCENVCPVLATSHSAEGLNQQTYNRCVGTRYCANNCPYKTRRFNWWTYSHEDAIANLGLNPDVTVRSRGVMEKCTFCVQRITEVKIQAKNAGRTPADGEIRTACQQSCPADAMVFGDLNDPKSAISVWMSNPRRYAVLDELGVAPAVGYLARVLNAPQSDAAPVSNAPETGAPKEPGHGR